MNYTPTEFSTAEDKAEFVEHFIKFVEKGFPQSLFTKKFYQRLSMCFGHIAHYNQLGFWETFFTNSLDKVEFLKQTVDYPCYGQPDYTYCDAEREIQKRLKMNSLETWQKIRDEEENNREWSEYQRLKKKFE